MSISNLDICTSIDDLQLTLSTWVSDARVETYFGLTPNAGHVCMWSHMNEAQATALIEHLHMHIANIKKNEIELIAMNAEAKE